MSFRLTSTATSLPDFTLGASKKSFNHQYANIYFIRLQRLRGCVERNARERWESVKGSPKMVPRVLDVTKGELCYIVGTVYMDMVLKPNILEDIGRDFSIPPPPPPPKYLSTNDIVILEDESGRITLVGERLRREKFVTGIIMAALGIETPDGQFEVVDLCFAGLAPQQFVPVPIHDHSTMEVDDTNSSTSGSWIALLSGLELSSTNPKSSETELYLQLLVEYILGESGNPSDQALSSQISRVIIAGNTMSLEHRTTNNNQKTPSFSSTPADHGTLTAPPTSITSKYLHELALALPVHILPGASDPSGTILPQQPFPRAMFGAVRNYINFSCETNPAWLVVDGQKMLITSGQPLDDMLKYIDSIDRLGLAVQTLEWRHIAPTAPDTLWCYPYLTQDPFMLETTPQVYIIGNQPSFATALIQSKNFDHTESRKRNEGNILGEVKCRVILLPKFCDTPLLVLLHTKSLECKTVEIDVHTSLLPKEK